MSDRIIYSLKAGCKFCNRWGTIDDVTLVCTNCGNEHAITEEEERQRNLDISLHSIWAHPGRFGLRRWGR